MIIVSMKSYGTHRVRQKATLIKGIEGIKAIMILYDKTQKA